MPMQSHHFSSLQIRSVRHFPNSRKLYTLTSYIFTTQSLHKRRLQAYTSLQQGTYVLYCGPILQVHVHVNGFVHAKSGGRWSCLAGRGSPQRLPCTKS